MGELDLSTLPRLSDAFQQVVTQHSSRVAIDLDGITVLDDAALGILLGLAARIRAQDGHIYLISSNPKINEYLHKMGINLIIPIHNAVHDIAH